MRNYEWFMKIFFCSRDFLKMSLLQNKTYHVTLVFSWCSIMYINSGFILTKCKSYENQWSNCPTKITNRYKNKHFILIARKINDCDLKRLREVLLRVGNWRETLTLFYNFIPNDLLPDDAAFWGVKILQSQILAIYFCSSTSRNCFLVAFSLCRPINPSISKGYAISFIKLNGH